MSATEQKRPLADIAFEIRQKWAKVHYTAEPYLEAMEHLVDVTDRFYQDEGKEVVRYFLNNAFTWKGEDARRIKAELKAIIK